MKGFWLKVPANLDRIVLLALAIIALMSSRCFAQGVGCSKPDIQHAAGEVAATRNRLLRLPIGDGLNPEVPPGGTELIDRVKDNLNHLAVAYMRCLSLSSKPDPKRIEKDLSSIVNSITDSDQSIRSENATKDFGGYGSELRFEAKATPDQRNMISITPSFAIECASDSMLMVFAPHRDHWHEVLRWQSAPYQEVSGAFWSFLYAVSPADSAGAWYVVTSYVNGWCSSTWSAINYAVLRPTSAASKPRVLLTKSHSMWWGGDDLGGLVVNPRDFEVRFVAESVDTGILTRLFVQRYSVEGDSIRRIQPVAVSPRDFVDEWIVSGWGEASAWSAPSTSASLQKSHDELARLESNHKADFNFGSVRRCLVPDDFQVELCRDDGGSFYFRVRGRASFTMMTVSQAADPTCKGPNILDSMATK